MTNTEAKCRERLAAIVEADNPTLASMIRDTRNCWAHTCTADPAAAHYALRYCCDRLTDEQANRLVDAVAVDAEWAHRTLYGGLYGSLPLTPAQANRVVGTVAGETEWAYRTLRYCRDRLTDDQTARLETVAGGPNA